MNLEKIKKVLGIGKDVKDEEVEQFPENPAGGPTDNQEDKLENYEGQTSFVEGEQSNPRGVKRPVVIGVGAIIVVTFVSGMIWGFSDDASEQQAARGNTAGAPSSVVDIKPDQEQLSRLKQYDQKDADKQNKTLTPEQAQKLQQAQANAVESNNGRSSSNGGSSYSRGQYQQLPTIPQQRNTSFPYSALQLQPAAAPAEDTASKKEETVAEKAKDMFNSAIAFAFGSSSGKGASSDSAPSGAYNAAQPADSGVMQTASASTASSSYSGMSSMTYVPTTSSMIQAGTLIPAILTTGVNTDAGDMVQAQITSNVYDSLTGTTLLIPAGSRLLGTYTAGNNGRVNISWQTLIIQDYGAWNLGNSMVAVDSMGYAGLKGHVDSHMGKVLGAGSIATGLAAVAGVAGGNSNVSTTSYSYGQLAAQGAMSNFLNTASSFFQKNLDTAETITIDPGYQFNIFVTQAISF